MQPQRFGKFWVVKQLGEGGMGVVLLARQRGLGQVERLVVLKRLHDDLAKDPEFVERFLNEARISARLSHPNVIQTYEFGQVDGGAFLTLEYVRGANLAQLTSHLHKAGALWPLDVLLEIMLQVCGGLRYVHELPDFDGRPLNIVHGDLSPSNIMVSYDGVTKLLDFGVAHVQRATTPPRKTMGKLGYLAPEQWQQQPVTQRTDVYTLGLLFWEMLTAKRLFANADPGRIFDAVVRGKIEPPSSQRYDLPPLLDALVMRMLAVDAAERPATARQLAAEIEAIAGHLGLVTGPRLLQRFMEPFAAQSGSSEAGRLDPLSDNRPAILLVDDEQVNLDAMIRTFRHGYRVLSTTSPLEALNILEREPVDVLLTDMRMPHMTGLDLIRQASRLGTDVLKVVVSAYADAETLLDSINTGQVQRYVVKPWRPHELRQTVDALLLGQVRGVPTLERLVARERQQKAAAAEELDATERIDGANR